MPAQKNPLLFVFQMTDCQETKMLHHDKEDIS
jgi:hypothetical protein